jgi:hypothetical protein
MEPIIQPPESVRQPLRAVGAALVLGAVLAMWTLPSADVIAWLCVAVAGACLFRIPWDYRISGPGLGGWALLILSSLFSFVFVATAAKLMMLMLTGTGAWLTGVAPEGEAESTDP